MSTESKWKRYKRYVRYMAEWLFTERIRGLDFSMRDLSLIKASQGVFHGYSKTDEIHAKSIFGEMDKLAGMKNLRLLDVGCGKGAFLREASRYPFLEIVGIEYSEELTKIAKKNFKILKLDNRVKIYHADAIEFEHYRSFNFFYFFNPFESTIMELVIDRIIDSCRGTFWVVLHNPVCAEVIEKSGGIERGRLYDTVKSYETVIYEFHNDCS